MESILMFPSKNHNARNFGKNRAVILGTNEIASAIAVYFTHLGIRVVLSHDPTPPVIRRGMAFHDALFGEDVSVNAIHGTNCDNTLEILDELNGGDRVIVTRLGLSHLLPIGGFGTIVDARMHKASTMPILKYLAPITIGLGPGFIAAENCDAAIETHPEFVGQILLSGETIEADGKPSPLGDLRGERFIYTPFAGRWSTHMEIGNRIFQGMTLGMLGRDEIKAQRDGIIRGLARDGTEMPADVKLVEIDPRGRNAQWQGIDLRAKTIAESTLSAYLQVLGALTNAN